MPLEEAIATTTWGSRSSTWRTLATMMALRTTLTQGRVLRSVLNSQKPLVRSLACFSSSQIYSKEVTNVQNQFSSFRSFLSGPVGVSANRRPYSTPSLAEEVMKAKVSSTEKEGSNKSSGDQGSGDQQQQEPPKGPKPLTKWQKIGYAAFGVLFTGGIVINAIVFCKWRSAWILFIIFIFSKFELKSHNTFCFW